MSALALDPYVNLVGPACHGTGDVVVSYPEHKAGDLAVLIVEHQDANSISLADAQGFVAVQGSPTSAGTGTNLSLFFCRCSSNAMPNPTVADPGDHIYARILTFRGVSLDDDEVFNASAAKAETQDSSPTVAAPAVTTTVDGCLIVNVFAVLFDTSGSGLIDECFIDYTNAALIEIHEVADGRTAAGGGGGFGVCTGVKVAAGDTGETVATITDASGNPSTTGTVRSFTFALTPGTAAPEEATFTPGTTPSTPVQGAEAYARMLKDLLPPGRLWNLDPGSTLSLVLEASGDELARVEARAAELLLESDPQTASELLVDYERALGLASTGTDAERRARIVALLIRRQRYRPADFRQVLAPFLGQGAEDVQVIETTRAQAIAMGDEREIFRFFVYRNPALPGDYDLAAAQAIVDAMKPSHTMGHVIASTGFLCDDPDSICDRDILGA